MKKFSTVSPKLHRLGQKHIMNSIEIAATFWTSSGTEKDKIIPITSQDEFTHWDV